MSISMEEFPCLGHIDRIYDFHHSIRRLIRVHMAREIRHSGLDPAGMQRHTSDVFRRQFKRRIDREHIERCL